MHLSSSPVKPNSAFHFPNLQVQNIPPVLLPLIGVVTFDLILYVVARMLSTLTSDTMSHVDVRSLFKIAFDLILFNSNLNSDHFTNSLPLSFTAPAQANSHARDTANCEISVW